MRKKVIIQVFLVLFICLQAWYFYINTNYTYIGIVVEKSSTGDWQIAGFEKTRPELLNQLQIGDVVKEVNQVKADNYSTIQRWKSIDQANSITVLHNNEEKIVTIPHVTLRESITFETCLFEIISVFFAFLIYLKMPKSQSARLLALVFISVALVYMSLGASGRGDIIGKIFVTSALMAIPIIFLHFLIVFFKEKGNIVLPAKMLKYLYGFVIISLLSKLAYISPGMANYVYALSSEITILYFLMGITINFSFLIHIYFKYRKESTYLSTIIKTIWFGLFISFFPFAFLSFLPLLLDQPASLNPDYTGAFVLVFPITFTYLILSKKLYDIDVLLRRFLVTIIIGLIPSVVIVTLFNKLILQSAMPMKETVYSFLIVLLLFSFVLYSLEYFTSKFEPFVFPRKHKLQNALRKISKNLGSISSFREIKEIILVDIVQTLQVYGGAVVFKYPHHLEAITEGDINAEEVEELLESGWFDDHPTYTCFVINHHEEYTSYLVMTKKRTNTLLGLEDRQWLNLIISYLAVSLENVYLIRKLTMRMQELAAQVPNEETGDDFVWFRKLMFELQEKERVRIATDLHDTTMQDLFFLKKRFADIMVKLKMNPEQQDQFRSVIEFVEIINTNLRQSCFDLHPHLLQEIGLVQTVERLVERESYESSFDIQFQAERTYLIEKRDLDTKRHLFRMIQEMITNAKKHSHASRVKIQIVTAKDTFSLLYEDNGVGFDEGRLMQKQIGASGIGIEQIKSRTVYLKGKYDLQTSIGSGVKIQITIPMREGLTA
ncbi:ATP-binding protein [Paenibacillus sp. GP183]|uniref:sensor histidine kinase n=1 Tax=Paenibacillus sp. GP183 TaxID=1882751 RepID=UPI00089BFFE5|nr:ATP-binding protein [Paenibacillus sp. GP183]SEC50153.1 two-component system, NarL family, sensor histidine kinase ComP [Paenibacillus sp. GP183]